MAERNDPKGPRQRRDDTSELTFGDLEPVASVVGGGVPEESVEEELGDELEEVAPPPVPGLGRPRREKKRDAAATLQTGAAGPPKPEPPATPRAADTKLGIAPRTPSRPAPSLDAVKSPSRVPPPKSVTPAKAPSLPKPARTPTLPPAAPAVSALAPTVPPPAPSVRPSPPDAAGSKPGRMKSVPPPAPPASSPGSVAAPSELATGPTPTLEPPARKRRAVAGPNPPPSPQPSAASVRAPSQVPPPPALRATDDSAEELRALLERELEHKPEPERAARVCYELARLSELDLGDLAKAAEHYQTALRHAPDHVAALRGARRTLAALGRHAALPALFDAEVKVTRDPGARARLLCAKARVMDEQLRQTAPALKVYREALALDPGNLPVLRAIERALRRDKAWAELAGVYEQLANAVSDPSLRAAWTSVRARLVESQLSDPVPAAALYERALEADPHASAALAALKRLSVRHERWPELLSALRREHDLCRDEDARLAILTAIARIEERRLGDGEAAARTLEQAVALRPEERSLLADLARLHRSAGRHRPEAEALARLVEQTEDAEERAALSHRVARLHEQELGTPEVARTWYERALEADPAHRAAALALAHLHEQREEWDAVVGVWTARAEALGSPRERADLHHRVGVILEQRCGRPERAAEAHARALGLDPDHGPAFDELTRLLASAGRWRELAEQYQRAIDRGPHDAVVVAWLFRLGAILEDRLDDQDGAIAVYDRILARDPKNVGALHAVGRAAERAKRFDRLASVLVAEAERTADRARAHMLRHRAAEITADGLGDPSSAARALEAILKDDPKHRASLETLARLYTDGGKWEELVGVYRRLALLLGTAVEKVRLALCVGEIHELQLGNDRAAIEAYREALRMDPELEPARVALMEALERTGAHAELAAALEEQLARNAAPHVRARRATALGALYEEKLGDVQGALAAYGKALEAEPLHRPALDARERLLTEGSKWTELVAALSSEASASDDPFFSTQAALRAAMVLAEQGAVAPAIEAFRPVFNARPDHVGALLAVEELYARARDEDGLAATYAKLAGVVRDPKAKLAVLEELARARAAAGASTSEVQRQILGLAPNDATALEAMAKEAEESGDRDSLLSMQARLASSASDPTVGAFHQGRVGELLLADGDAGGALAAFRRALELDPRSASAARGLTRAAREAADPEALREAARHEEEVTRDRAVAVGVLLEAAGLRRKRGDVAAAAEDCERALALDPDDEAAAAGLRAARITAEGVPRLIEHLGRAALAAKSPARACALHLAVAQLQADSRTDLPAAIAATQRALVARPEDPSALSRLAAYLERNGQWREAAATLEKVLARARDEELVDAHLRLASIAERHLDDVETALRSLRAVLKRSPDRPDALAALVRLERAMGRTEEALRLARVLAGVAGNDAEKAGALTAIAELEHARGQHAAAAEAALSAVRTLGPRSKAAEVVRLLVASAPEHASWDDLANALTSYLDGKPAIAEQSATYRELARIFTKAHNRPDRAIATLREGVAACPGDAEIGLALANALVELGAHDKALGELRRLLGEDVRIASAWRAMADRVRAIGEVENGAAVVLAPLVTLGEASEEEARVVRSRVPRPATAPAGILGDAGLKQIVEASILENSAVALTIALSDVIVKLEGIDHDRLGIAKRDRIRPGDPHPMRAIADRVGLVFGVPELELYVVKGSLDHAVIEPGSPPALLVPAALEEQRDALVVFELARPLALLSRHLHPLDRVAPDVMERILVAAARQYEPEFTLGGRASPELDAETKRVAKALPWLQRGRIQEAASAFAAAPPADVRAWIRSVHRMARRAALLVSDDLIAALEALGEPLGADNAASDLARFWVSDPAMRFRRAVAQQI